MVLAYTFFKPYNSKLCNGFSFYIYIEKPLHILEYNGLKK